MWTGGDDGVRRCQADEPTIQVRSDTADGLRTLAAQEIGDFDRHAVVESLDGNVARSTRPTRSRAIPRLPGCGQAGQDVDVQRGEFKALGVRLSEHLRVPGKPTAHKLLVDLIRAWQASIDFDRQCRDARAAQALERADEPVQGADVAIVNAG